MRICLLSKEYPPDTGWGGIGAYNYQIAHGLKEIGHDVEVISLAAKRVPGSPDQPRTGLILTEGIPVHRVPWHDYMGDYWSLLTTVPTSHFMIKTNMALWKKLEEIHQENPFDVVEAPEHLAEGLLPSLTKSLPIIIKLHTPYSKFIAERFHNTTPTFDHQFIALLERIAMLSADSLISPSVDMARYVSQDINYPLEAIKIVRNPVDANKFSPDGQQALPSDGRLTVLFVGRLEERKGVRYLIAAVPQIVREFPNVRFVVIGSDTKTGEGYTFVLPQLQEALASSGHSDNVTFIPHVPLSEMPSYYRSSDICIAPSLYDNAPYTCLEAMSTGKAFIGTDAGGMPEYVVDGYNGLIIPSADTPAIARSVLRLLKDGHERSRLGVTARQYVLDNLHRTKIAEINEATYKAAIASFSTKQSNTPSSGKEYSALADTQRMLYLYHKMLCDLLFAHSIRYRITHRFFLALHRPRLMLAKILVASAKKFAPRAASSSKHIRQLEQQIIQKDAERARPAREQLDCLL